MRSKPNLASLRMPEAAASAPLGADAYVHDMMRAGHLCRCPGYENILRAVKKTMYKRLGKPMPEA